MKKTILTVMCVALVAASAAGCATNQPAGAGATSDSESVATDDNYGMIEVPVGSDEESGSAPEPRDPEADRGRDLRRADGGGGQGVSKGVFPRRGRDRRKRHVV